LVDKTFQDQLGRNMETYVDDLVIKSNSKEDLLKDVKETFRNLRKINMKLNPTKWLFGVEEGKFLGHLITKQMIKANLDKVEVVKKMTSPKTKKDVQRLNGRLGALHKFMSKLAEKSLTFFKTLKGFITKADFKWSTEAEEAFEKIKEYMVGLPDLTSPSVGERLFLYLSVGKEAMSAILIADRTGKETPVYFSVEH
jgi:hypothetical protein